MKNEQMLTSKYSFSKDLNCIQVCPKRATSLIRGEKSKKLNKEHKALFRANISRLFILYFMLIFLKINTSKKISLINQNFDNKITIYIRGNGEQPILYVNQTSGDKYPTLPNKIQINNNEEITEVNSYIYDFGEREDNVIVMTWSDNLNDCANMFKSLENLISIDFTYFDFSSVTSMQSFFEGCTSLKSIDFSNKNANSLGNMAIMFSGCSSLISVNFENFQTNNLEFLNHMFLGCSSLQSLDLSSLKAPYLKQLFHAFDGCTSLKEIHLGTNIKTSQVTDFGAVFQNCVSLTSIDLSSFTTESLITVRSMFSNCKSLTNLDLSSFHTPNLENMNQFFSGCSNLTSINISNLITSKVVDMSYLFSNCISLLSLDVSSFNTEKVIDMSAMFRDLSSLVSLDVSNFNTESVKTMSHMFFSSGSLRSLDLKNFNTPALENMDFMFAHCYSLIYLDVSNFKTSKIINFYTLFYNCASLTSLDLSSFDTSSVIKMSGMFGVCNRLEYLNLSNFDTSSLVEMNQMFEFCFALKWVDIRNFKTDKVTDMHAAFHLCTSLTSLDLRHFVTTSVDNMCYLFSGCNSLQNLDISSFDTSNVIYMQNMFEDCHALKTLDLKHFDTRKATSFENMFFNCIALTSLDVTSFNTQSVNNMKLTFNKLEKLIFLDLTSFDIYDSTDVTTILDNCNSDLIICYNKSRVSQDFKDQANKYKIGCYEICMSYSKKYILDTETCINDCETESTHKYEYNNVCYSSCPNKTEPDSATSFLCVDCKKYYNYDQTSCIDEIPFGYYNNDTTKKTIDKCPDECSECSLETVNSNLCLSCNTGNSFYQKDNDLLNHDSMIKCYNVIEDGYYLDHDIYKSCYERCKTCNEAGTEENNNCVDCKGDYVLDENKNCIEKVTTIVESTIKAEELITSTELIEPTIKTEKLTEPIIESTELIEPTIKTEELIEPIIKSTELIEPIITSTELIEPTIKTEKLDGSTIKAEESVEPTIKSDENIEGPYETNTIKTNDIIINNNNSNFIYEIKLNSEDNNDVKNNVRHTFIELKEETFNKLKSELSLGGEDKIFIRISENTHEDNQVTADYIYEFLFENGTKLNLSDIDESIYADVYVPIVDIDSAKFDLAKSFAELGYDIFNINSKFYHDFCIHAHIGDNDITLKDRRKDIYPNNITLCKENCKYKGINLEERRVICTCNLNNEEEKDDKADFDEDKNANFVTYLVDKINYKVYLCYKLFFNLHNLRTSYAFFIILSIFVLLLIINIYYICKAIEKLKNFFINEGLELKGIDKEEMFEIKNMNEFMNINNENISNPPKKNKKDKAKPANKKKKDKQKFKKETFTNMPETNKRILEFDSKKKKKSIKARNINIKINNTTARNDNKNERYEQLVTKEDDINELPFSKAIEIDKRNIIKIYFSFLIEKLDLVSIIFNKDKIKIVLYEEYILSLVINFSINALLYSDDVVSNKYHNNGELDFAVSLVLSLISNIISSILCNHIKYTTGIENNINLVLETKHKIHYYRNVQKFLSYLKIKFIYFFICQIIFVANCIYYTVIFCILYSHSQISLIINFCYSFIEGIITSLIISFIILITRKIGLCCLSKEMYNTSKYINNKF